MTLTRQALDNADLDVKHIEALATSDDLTATDRKGQTKKTWAGIVAELSAAATILLSRMWATKTDGPVADGEYSAKYHAQAAAEHEAGALAAKNGAVAAAESVGSYTTLALANAALAASLVPLNKGVYVTADGDNNGFYANRSGALVLESKATLPAIASLIKTAGGNGRLVITDENNNILIEISTGKVTHPDTNAMRDGVAAAAVAAAAVKLLNGNSSVVLTDENSNILAEITATKVNHPDINIIRDSITGLDVIKAAVKVAGGSGSVAFLDSQNNILAEITTSKFNHPDVNRMRSDIANLQAGVGADWSAVAALAEVLHIILYGQSLAVGNYSTSIQTSSLPAYAKKFVGGVRATDGGTDPAVIYASLVAFSEQVSGVNAETPCGGMLQMIAQLLLAEDGIDIAATGQMLLATAPGEPGKSAAELAPGSAYFARLQDAITYGAARSSDLGKTYGLGAICDVQGETDRNNTAAAWLALKRQYQAAVQAQVLSVTGQSRPLPMLVYQMASHLFYGTATPTIAMASLDLIQDQYVALATPMYHLPYNTAQLPHLTGVGSKWLGAYFGMAIKRWIFDGIKPTALVPKKLVKLGNTAVVSFAVDPGRRLVLDTVGFPDPGNYGFTAVDNGGSAVSINSVQQINHDSVRVEFATAGAAMLRYGWIGPVLPGYATPFVGGGCFRDNTGDSIIFDPSGINKPMHKWVPIFQKEVI